MVEFLLSGNAFPAFFSKTCDCATACPVVRSDQPLGGEDGLDEPAVGVVIVDNEEGLGHGNETMVLVP